MVIFINIVLTIHSSYAAAVRAWSPHRSKMMQQAKEPSVWRVFMRYLPVLIICTFFTFPVFWMATTSLKNENDWFRIPPRLFPANDSLAANNWFLFAPTPQNLEFLLSVSIKPLNAVYDQETGQPKLNMATCPFDEAGNRIPDPARCEPLLERASQVLPPEQNEIGRIAVRPDQ
jgi:hypothetical protein